MQAELAMKDKLKSDYQCLRQKYIKRKEDWARQLERVEARAKSQKDSLVAELQSQVSYYRAQADDLGKQMRQEIKKKQEECEQALHGGHGYRQALIQTEGHVEKLQDKITSLNSMLEKSEAEIDRYRGQLEQARLDAANQEAKLKQEAIEAVKAVKAAQKEKSRRQIESLEALNKENMALRMQETHSMATELHKKDLEIIEEKF